MAHRLIDRCTSSAQCIRNKKENTACCCAFQLASFQRSQSATIMQSTIGNCKLPIANCESPIGQMCRRCVTSSMRGGQGAGHWAALQIAGHRPEIINGNKAIKWAYADGVLWAHCDHWSLCLLSGSYLHSSKSSMQCQDN